MATALGLNMPSANQFRMIVPPTPHQSAISGAAAQQSANTGPTPVPIVPFGPRPAYRFKPNVPQPNILPDGRKQMPAVRRTVDYVAFVNNYVEERIWNTNGFDKPHSQPDPLFSYTEVLPLRDDEKAIDCVCNKLVRSAQNKIKCPVYAICWTPEGRRLLTGASSGEFTLWNGTGFNFETILQAHDCAIRTMEWSHSEQWMVTGDHDGFIKYWQANMNNVKMFQAHKEAVRAMSFSPTDNKFVTASDDGTARVWDFMRCHEERILRGHGSDVRAVDWHPQKSLLVTGSRDSQQPVKFWDGKTGQCLATLHDHKNGVMDVRWNRNGNWLLSTSRDHLIKLYDIRMMKEIRTFRGHKKEVVTAVWHPVHETLFASGGSDGSIMYWLAEASAPNDRPERPEREVGVMENAHDQTIWCLRWHPLGHVLASGSNDNSTKFWTRNKPGDAPDEFFGMSALNTDQMIEESSPVKRTPIPLTDDKKGAIEPLTSSIPGIGQLDVFKFKKEDEDGIPGLGGLGDRGQKSHSHQAGGQQSLNQQSFPRKPYVGQAQREFEKIWNVTVGDERGIQVIDVEGGSGNLPGLRPSGTDQQSSMQFGPGSASVNAQPMPGGNLRSVEPSHFGGGASDNRMGPPGGYGPPAGYGPGSGMQGGPAFNGPAGSFGPPPTNGPNFGQHGVGGPGTQMVPYSGSGPPSSDGGMYGPGAPMQQGPGGQNFYGANGRANASMQAFGPGTATGGPGGSDQGFHQQQQQGYGGGSNTDWNAHPGQSQNASRDPRTRGREYDNEFDLSRYGGGGMNYDDVDIVASGSDQDPRSMNPKRKWRQDYEAEASDPDDRQRGMGYRQQDNDDMYSNNWDRGGNYRQRESYHHNEGPSSAPAPKRFTGHRDDNIDDRVGNSRYNNHSNDNRNQDAMKGGGGPVSLLTGIVPESTARERDRPITRNAPRGRGWGRGRGDRRQ